LFPPRHLAPGWNHPAEINPFFSKAVAGVTARVQQRRLQLQKKAANSNAVVFSPPRLAEYKPHFSVLPVHARSEVKWEIRFQCGLSTQNNAVAFLWRFAKGQRFRVHFRAMLTGTRPLFSGPSLTFCLPAIATRPIVLSIGAEHQVSGVCRPGQPDPGTP
jgi:hypothetical protein